MPWEGGGLLLSAYTRMASWDGCLQDWCDKNGYPDDEVLADKAFTFLDETGRAKVSSACSHGSSAVWQLLPCWRPTTYKCVACSCRVHLKPVPESARLLTLV